MAIGPASDASQREAEAEAMSADPLTLVLPMPDNIANGAHGHWRTKHAAKVTYWKALDAIQIHGTIGPWIVPSPPRTPFAKATLSSVMHLGGAMDDSNAMRRHKWVEDWLKTRGYIVDDRKKCLTWTGFPEQIVKRDGNHRLVLTLTPIAA
ncbi:MAG: hypothetical protein JWL61_4982 [Gemmatimonadetes bacterium]|nr:hypothetical protein [Gemmatimonadota bacterium]